MNQPLPADALTEKIQKKFRLACDLFDLAFTIKKTQLARLHPEWTDRELNLKTYELIERGCR